MPLPWEDIELDAAAFAKRWKNARSEKSDAQGFVRDFLAVFGVEDAAAVGNFENPALREEGHGFMDYFWPGKIAVEMKSRGKDLKVAYAQLKEHVLKLPSGEMPELLLVSDFEKMIIYRRTANKKAEFLTKNLHKHVRRFGELAGYGTVRVLENQYEVDVMAAEKMARLHAAFDKSGYEGHELEIYLVRLLFCMFAEDTGIFEQYSFLSYVENSKEDGSDLSQRLATLFEILDTPSDKRSKRTHLADELKQFRYINGSLFSDTLRQPDFDAKMRKVLIHCCEFDWSKISPAIFGSIFQGIMDKNRRRKVGAHYTSIENIEKLLKPLFLDGLWAEFEQKQGDKQALDAFHQKLAGLKFFDPACGCGNFLMIAYQRLRELEFELLKILHGAVLPGKGRQKMLDLSMYVRVSVEQFYGIEIEDFPCEIAKVGLWLIDHLMNREASLFFAVPFNRLPLTQNPTIVHGNAMRIDWESVVPKEECSYILSNPPYVGKQYQSKEQKDDVALTLRDIPGYGVLDYVACWYFTAAQYVQGTEIRVGFVSTNSVTQGEQVAVLWRELFAKNVKINFGYTMFKWWNEGKYKAAVHCVIIGFSLKESDPKHIFEEQDGKIKARRVKNINPYLIDGPSVLITSRSKPLCDVPEIVFGSMPNDGGHLLFSNEEKREFLKLEPEAKRWIQPFVGAIEFINGISRWCLWLVDISPGELRNLTEVRKVCKPSSGIVWQVVGKRLVNWRKCLTCSEKFVNQKESIS